jgi:hypothetical protein
LEYRLHPVGTVTSGIVAHPVKGAGELLRFFREVTSCPSDELTLNAGLLHAPDGSRLGAIAVCHCGSLADAEAATLPIKRFGTPMIDTVGPASYVDTNTTIFDPAFPRGARNYWKASFLTSLSDAAIDAMIAQFAACPSPMSMLVLEHFHGAATRVGIDETAFPHRRESYNLMVISQWLDGKDDAENIEWERKSYDALRPYMARGSYSNYQTEDDAEGGLERAYGPNHERLVALKNKFDPTNLFHLNTNVRPIA